MSTRKTLEEIARSPVNTRQFAREAARVESGDLKTWTPDHLLFWLVGSYESDTFSASGSQITQAEACEIARRLVRTKLVPGTDFDGIDVSEMLADIREGSD